MRSSLSSTSRTCVRASGTERGAAPRVRQGQRQRLGEEQPREEGKTLRSSTASESSQPLVSLSVDTIRYYTASESSQSAASQTRCRSALPLRIRETEEKEKDGKRERQRRREGERERERHLARVYARASWADSSATKEQQHPPIYNATCSLLPSRLGGRSFGIKPRACCWDGSLPAGL